MFLKKFKDRYFITKIVFFIVIGIILFRLATIMIVEGEAYREEAENRIFRTIPLTAPRGEIRDRYGRLLAGNRPSFTLRIMKNEIDENINEVILRVIRILEENEDRYTDEFPIVIDEEGNFIFLFDVEIENMKERLDIADVESAAEAFYVLANRYRINEIEIWNKENNIQDAYQGRKAFASLVNEIQQLEDTNQNNERRDNFFEWSLSIQQQLIQNVHVPISIRTWKFTEQMRKEVWLESHRIRDFDVSPKEAFIRARDKVYRIPETFSHEDARKIMVVREQLRNQGYLQFHPVRIAQDISYRSVVQIEERINELPGINIAVEPVRFYPEGKTAAHILGYMGRISQQWEIDRFIKELGYAPSDLIGKTGIEHRFEEYLKGTDGYMKVIVDSRGRLIRVLERKEPVPGNTLFLTIDLNLQRKTEEVMADVLYAIQNGEVFETQWGSNRLLQTNVGPRKNATSASTVVKCVNTGEVLALANSPSFDPNLFATGISTADWNSLLPENERDPLAPRPLANIAMSTAVQPGSIYKMLVGLAALEQGLDPNYRILDRGFIQIGGHSFGNWLWNTRRTTMGYQNLYQAIADSNNFYFYSLGAGYNFSAGRPLPVPMSVDKMIKYTNMFGLDETTGVEIDVPRERSGGVPNIERKTATMKVLLERQLRRLLRPQDFDATIINPTPNNIDRVIEEIVGWIYENPSRGVVYNRLVDLGILPQSAGTYADLIVFSFFRQARWSIADTLNFSIGQGEHAYTPLQMASYMSILANGGYRFRTSVIRKIQSVDGEIVMESPPDLIERLPLRDHRNLEHVNYGMLQVNKTGTARSFFNRFPIDVAGKTGTAQRSGKIPPIDEVQYLRDNFRNFGVSEAAVEAKMEDIQKKNKDNNVYQNEETIMRKAILQLNPRLRMADLDKFKEDYDNYAWYTGFAPFENPEIAISVLIFQGGTGGFAAPIFREVVAEFMGLNHNYDTTFSFTGNYLTR